MRDTPLDTRVSREEIKWQRNSELRKLMRDKESYEKNYREIQRAESNIEEVSLAQGDGVRLGGVKRRILETPTF